MTNQSATSGSNKDLKDIIGQLTTDELLLIHQGSSEEILSLLANHGWTASDLTTYEGLRLIRESMLALSDDDLVTISGGEIGKALAVTVATVTGSLVAGTIVAGAVGGSYAAEH